MDELKLINPEEVHKKWHHCDTSTGECWDASDEQLCEAQAKLTIQQVVEWGNEPCPHHLENPPRHMCGICWEELRRMAGK